MQVCIKNCDDLDETYKLFRIRMFYKDASGTDGFSGKFYKHLRNII